ncbi:hypothetical protein RJ640_020086 [Escallonia rubra]|uniref:Uncharacterized protein n=1 Tax=Escallonia rubra TaxID=112253 RepID=A0AA88QYP9_9ASTE|nr:hypothetical protein RJ640_020086 [Escallonia rubra]
METEVNEAPSWADQWGARGIGAREEINDTDETNKDEGNIKKKVGSSAGLSNIRKSLSNDITWIKNKSQKKKPEKSSKDSTFYMVSSYPYCFTRRYPIN